MSGKGGSSEVLRVLSWILFSTIKNDPRNHTKQRHETTRTAATWLAEEGAKEMTRTLGYVVAT